MLGADYGYSVLWSKDLYFCGFLVFAFELQKL